MRLILDVYDAAGNRVGDGPVSTLTAAQVTRILDGVGTINFETPATDERALNLLTPQARFRLRADYQSVVREIGRGVVLKRELRENEGGALLIFDCADALADLRHYTTHVGRTYSQQTVADIVHDLIGLVPDWTADVEPDAASMVVDARFDGVSVLDALRGLAENTGLHFRLAESGNVVEVGLFGTPSGVTAVNAETASSELYRRVDLALISAISAGMDSEEIANWIVPLGAGEDAAALTLRDSTRTSPYSIQTMTGPDGADIHYLADTGSIAAYGVRQQYTPFKNIAPIENTDADKIAAADALYDASVAWLERMKQPQLSYELTLVGLKETLRPGQTLGVRYRGRVEKNGRPTDYAHINQDMWLLRVTEAWGLESASIAVDVSNVDVAASSVEEIIVRGMNEIALRNLRPLVGVGCRSFVYPREIASGFPCAVPVEITDATMEILRVRVRLRTMPLRATASTASAGGDHNHRIAVPTSPSGFPSTNANPYLARNAAGGSFLYLLLNTNNSAHEFWTESSSGAHTHPLVYGVVDDTATPSGISLWINGVDRTTDFGGPWAGSGGNQNILMDVALMTDAIVNAAGGMYQSHMVEFRASGGHGRCEVTVEIYEVLQGIRVS